MATPVLQLYYGNERGVVYGPYHDHEISAKVRAQELLHGGPMSGPGYQVYAVKAYHLSGAREKIRSMIEHDKRES